jgi:catechol 2,3-dioxygenase-like lactoylglutathione lyase family enzyme
MSSAVGPVPGLTRVDHIGVTVPDLDEAHAFFTGVLGCEYLYTLGPFQHDDSWMSEHLGVADDTVMRRLHFYRLGGQAIFEVFEYEAAEQRLVPPRNSDVGGHHVALYVEDLDAAVAHLRALGITVMGDPTASRGPSEGQRWVYFLSPWGMQCELVSYPGGKAFDTPGYEAAPHPGAPRCP